jgi:hypothetical protein
MKIKFSHILASAAIVFSLVSLTSYAQEEGQTSNELQDVNHQELNLNDEDKTLIYEHDVKSGKNTPNEAHQNSLTPSTKTKASETHKAVPPASNSNTKDGDDALSFNFLFYIIQKYKFSDIIDQ